MNTVFSFNKVAYITLIWRTKDGIYERHKKPDYDTVHGHAFDSFELAPYLEGYELETLDSRARRLDIIDVWIPRITVHFTANKTLTFSGKRALNIWQAWQAKIFSKKKT